MRNNMADGSNIDNKESENAFEGSDDIVTTSNADINDLHNLKSQIMAPKMFVSDQKCLFKQLVCNRRTPEC